MKPAFTFVPLLLIASTVSFAQDLEVRKEAVGLLERANAVSLNPNLPNLERRVTFRVLDPTAKVQEGTFTRVVVQDAGNRDEITFGDYHVVDIWTNGQLATVRTVEVAPPEVDTMIRVTPIYLVSFNGEDVIRSLSTREADGHKLRCIEFDTIVGLKNDSNELCVDAANGTLVTERLGKEFIENREFFSFAGALLPARITYSYDGVPKLEISQVVTELTDATANVLAAPPDAQIRKLCTTYRRAIGESLPQPKPGNGTRNYDVVIRGLIESDGRVHDAVVQSSERPDLVAEALLIIQQWKFSPELCNGQPNTTEASFVLHFQAR